VNQRISTLCLSRLFVPPRCDHSHGEGAPSAVVEAQLFAQARGTAAQVQSFTLMTAHWEKRNGTGKTAKGREYFLG
jgi:hypothetical protein